jgi:hypothetical protein
MIVRKRQARPSVVSRTASRKMAHECCRHRLSSLKACPTLMLDPQSIIKFQRELDVALSLRAVDQAKPEGKKSVGRIQDRCVRNVEQFSPEFQPLEFAQREFLLDAKVIRGKTRAPHCTHSTSSKRARRGWPIRGRIEPLKATELTVRIESRFSPEHVRRTNTIGARPPRIGARSVVGKDGEWKSAAKLRDGAKLPVRDHRIDDRMQILFPSPFAADGKFINRRACEDVRNVVVAGSPLSPLILNILPVRRSRRRLAAGTKVADGVRHALRVGVSDLPL